MYACLYMHAYVRMGERTDGRMDVWMGYWSNGQGTEDEGRTVKDEGVWLDILSLENVQKGGDTVTRIGIYNAKELLKFDALVE